MEIFVNQESGAAYVRLRKPEEGETPQRTQTFAKHGIAMEWNGHGELLGVVFAGNGESIALYDTQRQNKIDSWLTLESAPKRQYVGPWPDQPGQRRDR